ncbi:putative transcription factor bzip protein [Neofusicoccum parvum]|nr:putative transcription factor bzip protein [Neofusicoccum parvum]
MSFNQDEAYTEAMDTFDFLASAFPTPERTQDDHTSAEQDANMELHVGAEYTLCDEVPGIWSYGYQMGPSAYQHAMERSPRLRGSNIKSSNSIFSDHISSLRDCIWNKWQQIGEKQPADIRLYKLQQSVSVMFSMFNGLTRPLAMSWYTPTKWYNYISDLTTWQLSPTREMYARLHPRYRPSALQITESYPAFIDWSPFPALRDKLILTHAANPLIDDILLDMANSYVVETDLSLLVHTARRPTPGYVHVWDIIQAMSDDDASGPPSNDSATTLPAPSAAAIFQSPARARLVFRLLRMDDGAAVYKLDPAVFAKHPELYSPELADVVAVGAPLASSPPPLVASPQAQPVRVPIPHPVRLDRETLNVYRHFADWSLNAICDARW